MQLKDVEIGGIKMKPKYIVIVEYAPSENGVYKFQTLKEAQAKYKEGARYGWPILTRVITG